MQPLIDPTLLEQLSKAPLVVMAGAFVVMALHSWRVLTNHIRHDVEGTRQTIERVADTLDRIEQKLDRRN